MLLPWKIKKKGDKYLLPRYQGSACQKCVSSHFPFHSHIHSFPLRLLTLLQLSQTDTKWCLSLTGDGKSFPRRLYLWGEQSKVSTKQDTIFPHSHAQPRNSRATEYSSLVQQLCVVQTGWRREETICLIITRRFMLLLRPALTVASFCSKAPNVFQTKLVGWKPLPDTPHVNKALSLRPLLLWVKW